MTRKDRTEGIYSRREVLDESERRQYCLIQLKDLLSYAYRYSEDVKKRFDRAQFELRFGDKGRRGAHADDDGAVAALAAVHGAVVADGGVPRGRASATTAAEAVRRVYRGDDVGGVPGADPVARAGGRGGVAELRNLNVRHARLPLPAARPRAAPSVPPRPAFP